ncbi:MAG: tRNA (adenosine(37)-N6)-dimethylallyltransferase MiaA, partial [Verrucomicrobia bacterium]|nr:tRNA (adenosine(37)-N6)-dimethylallyltransferase MiaA [Verrucomicrobiota bacterium]
QRIAQRTAFMIANGLVEEVQELQAQGLETNPTASAAIGYREVLKFLRSGSEDLDSLFELISQNTRKLVRKQQAWFRNQCPQGKHLEAATATVPTVFQ